MSLGNLLSDGTVQTLVIAAVGLIWAAIKRSERYKAWATAQHEKAVLAVEAAVAEVYNVFVRQAKDSSPNGRLSDAERKQARNLAAQAAIAYGDSTGVDVKRTLGNEFVDLYIQQAVAKAKRGG